MTEINNITDRPGETLSRESALALIDEANRWQAAYNRVCDEKAEAEARLSDYEQALGTAEYALITGATNDVTEALEVINRARNTLFERTK